MARMSRQQVIAAFVFVVTATMAGLLVAGATDRLPPPGPEALLGLMAVPCVLVALLSLGGVTDIVRIGGLGIDEPYASFGRPGRRGAAGRSSSSSSPPGGRTPRSAGKYAFDRKNGGGFLPASTAAQANVLK